MAYFLLYFTACWVVRFTHILLFHSNIKQRNLVIVAYICFSFIIFSEYFSYRTYERLYTDPFHFTNHFVKIEFFFLAVLEMNALLHFPIPKDQYILFQFSLEYKYLQTRNSHFLLLFPVIPSLFYLHLQKQYL